MDLCISHSCVRIYLAFAPVASEQDDPLVNINAKEERMKGAWVKIMSAREARNDLRECYRFASIHTYFVSKIERKFVHIGCIDAVLLCVFVCGCTCESVDMFRREGNNHVDKCAQFAKAYLNGTVHDRHTRSSQRHMFVRITHEWMCKEVTKKLRCSN